MTTRRSERGGADSADSSVNEVRVVGRVSAVAELRALPSGDKVATLRVVVPRERPSGRQTVDVVECAAWSAGARRTVQRWRAGDIVEVSGALRRRFFRTGAGAASRFEVEVIKGRLVTRAARPDRPAP